jgi:CheY-like chemotaxis protein
MPLTTKPAGEDIISESFKITMKKVKILIVDDEEIIAQDLKMSVTEMGYSGFAVNSGKEAIRKISHNYEPDLILMDVTLKGDANGIQTARLIQKLKKIPVLFVTALSRSTVLKEIKDLVLTGYIQKPFCKEELQVSIRELLAPA